MIKKNNVLSFLMIMLISWGILSANQRVVVVEGVLHYGVTNMPGAVPRTSTYALSNATLPYLVKLADQGVLEAIRNDVALAKGVNTFKGQIT